MQRSSAATRDLVALSRGQDRGLLAIGIGYDQPADLTLADVEPTCPSDPRRSTSRALFTIRQDSRSGCEGHTVSRFQRTVPKIGSYLIVLALTMVV